MSGDPAEPYTAVVLAGGRSTRFGSDKASAMLLGRPLLAWVMGAMRDAPGGVVVVRARGQQLPPTEAGSRPLVVEDRYDAKGPLAGIVAGLAAVTTPLALAVSCDAPLAQPALVRAMAARGVGHDVVLPHTNGYPQPLFAIYRVATCLAPFEAAVQRGDLKITRAYAGLAVNVMREEAVKEHDPRLLSFMNANTPEALAALEPLARNLAPPCV